MKSILAIALILLSFNLIAQSEGLTSVYDTISDNCGYKNSKGEMVIPFGKYQACFSEKIESYGFVLSSEGKFIAIDQKDSFLYEVFSFDNGPDYEVDGVFRIVENEKIGYADAKTGKVLIKPQFDCAWSFENGVAKVSKNCTAESDGEHTTWTSSNWYHINKAGKKVNPPKPAKSKKPKLK